MEFTPEMLEKAKTAKTAEELLEMAKAENVEMTAEEAAKFFADLHKSGELSDEELENAAGGCGGSVKRCPSGEARSEKDVVYLFVEGQYVETKTASWGSVHKGIIRKRKVWQSGWWWYPHYLVEYLSGGSEWVCQIDILDPS